MAADLRRLHRLWRVFLSNANPEELAQQLVQKLAESPGADRVSLMLLDGAEQVLTVSAAVGLPPEAVAGTRIEVGQGIAGWVALTGRALLLPEGPGVPGLLRGAMTRKEITSALCVPLQVGGQVIGVLNLARLGGRSCFNPGHLRFVSLLAERAATAIRVGQLHTELRTGEEFFVRILESIPTSLLVIDRTLRIISANRNFLEKARRTARLTIGRRLGDVLPRTLLKHTRLDRMVEEVFCTGRTVECGRLSYRAPGLPARLYSCRLFPVNRQKTVENVVLLMDDITEREQLHEEVRRVERHLASVVECATDLVVSMSLDGRIASWNRAAETVLGFAADEVKGKAISSLCTEEDCQAMEDLVQQVARGEKVQDAGLVLCTREGREVPIAWSCAPMRDDEGKVVGVVAVGRDLTERRRMEAELIRSSKMAALGVMASRIAHEIRNPMGIIAGAAHLLHERPDDRQLWFEALQRIHSSIQRASLTIENLLRFAHPSSDHRENVDVNTLVEDTLGLLAPRMTQQRIDVRADLPLGLPAIRANRNLLQQVFTNILLNACNAMPQGGLLAVATRAHPEGQVEIRFTDTGHGISPENLSKVFDPFFTTMPVGQGTGLGLSLSYSIVQQLQGSIEVNSEVGKGATFTVRLPCSSGLLPISHAGPSALSASACGGRLNE